MADDIKIGTLGLDFDIPGLEEQVDTAAGKIEDRFADAGDSIRKTFVDRVAQTFRDTWEKLSSSMKSANREQAQSVKLDQEKVKAAKDLLKQHRDMHSMRRAKEIEDAGGPGARGIGPYGGRPRGGQSRIPSYLAQGASIGGNFLLSGGSQTGAVQAVGGAVGMGMQMAGLNPGWKQLVDVVTGLAVETLNVYNRRLESGLKAYQAGGGKGASMAMGGDFAAYTPDQVANIYYSLARRAGTVEKTTMQDVLAAETVFGLGSQASNLVGSSRRAGNQSAMADYKAIGAAIGLATAEGLDRGRFGEAFDLLSTALEQSTRGQADIQGVANRMAFVSSMGPMFQGTTTAKMQMLSTIGGIAGGASPFTKLAALRAGGLGKGATFAEASMRMATGLTETGEGLTTPGVLGANLEMFRTRWQAASEAGKAQLAMQYSLLTNGSVNQRDAYRLMDTYFKGPMPSVSIDEGRKRFEGMKVPRSLLRPRLERAAEEEVKGDVGRAVSGVISDVAGAISGVDDESFWEGGFSGATPTVKPSAAGAALTPSYSVNRGAMAGTTSSEFLQQFGASGATSGFGVQRKGGVTHKGRDLYFPPNTEVYSPEAGTVVYVGLFGTNGGPKDPNNGMLVEILGANTGQKYRLMHLEVGSVRVRAQQEIQEGQLIGRTKAKHWKTTKSHLHAEVVVGEGVHGNVDPAGAVDLARLIKPSSGAGGLTSESDSSSAVASSAQSAAPSAVNVKIQISDRTQNGIDVRQSVETNARKASAPAPGDTPALSEKP